MQRIVPSAAIFRSSGKSTPPPSCCRADMRSLSAKIVAGKVVTRAKLPEGAKLTIFVHAPEPEYMLDEEEAAGISRGIEDHRAGRVVPAAKLLAFLRRP